MGLTSGWDFCNVSELIVRTRLGVSKRGIYYVSFATRFDGEGTGNVEGDDRAGLVKWNSIVTAGRSRRISFSGDRLYLIYRFKFLRVWKP